MCEVHSSNWLSKIIDTEWLQSLKESLDCAQFELLLTIVLHVLGQCCRQPDVEKMNLLR